MMPKKYKDIDEVIFDSTGADCLPSTIYFKGYNGKEEPDDYSKKLLEAFNHPDVYSIEFDTEHGYYDSYSCSVKVTIRRKETEEERLDRIAKARKRSIAAKKAAETRRLNKKTKEQEERELLEKLKKKYE